jgi:hypothetical protein
MGTEVDQEWRRAGSGGGAKRVRFEALNYLNRPIARTT